MRQLRRAYCHVYNRAKYRDCGTGVDGVSVAAYGRRLEDNLAALRSELLDMTYSPQPVRQVDIGDRILRIPTVRDRIEQTSVRFQIELLLEKMFSEASHGSRPGKGHLTAIPRIVDHIKDGHEYIFKSDVMKCFPSIPHAPLLAKLKNVVDDPDLLELITRSIRSPLDETPDEPNTEGLHQGMPLSPCLCNLFLTAFDQFIVATGYNMTRYLDDFVICAGTEVEAAEAGRLADDLIRKEGLRLHDSAEKTFTGHASKGFKFLKYWLRLRDGEIELSVSKKSIRKLRESSKIILEEYPQRLDLDQLVEKAGNKIRGWTAYFLLINTGMDEMEGLDSALAFQLKNRLSRWDRKAYRDNKKLSLPQIADILLKWQARHQVCELPDAYLLDFDEPMH